MELIKGRPANEADRLDKEIRVYDLLDQLGWNTIEPTTNQQQQWKYATILIKFLAHLYARTFSYATDRKHNSIFL